MFLGSAARLALLSGEELMKELDGDGAFTDRRGDTLHRTVADVAGGEHARHARLEEKRTAIERRCATLRDIRSREDESRSSRSMSGGSQSVFGWAPIRRKSAFASTTVSVCDPMSRSTRCSSRPSPPPPTTWQPSRASILSVASICRTRYSDIPARSESARTTSVTVRAYRARCSAACPAELAPPTMKTSRPASADASDAGPP